MMCAAAPYKCFRWMVKNTSDTSVLYSKKERRERREKKNQSETTNRDKIRRETDKR